MFLFLWLLLAVGAAQLQGQQAPVPGPHPQSQPQLTARYVGSRACQSCHADIYARWQKTPMANVVRDPREHPEAILPDLASNNVKKFALDDVGLVYGSTGQSRDPYMRGSPPGMIGDSDYGSPGARRRVRRRAQRGEGARADPRRSGTKRARAERRK
jgi:hypothetical protein